MTAVWPDEPEDSIAEDEAENILLGSLAPPALAKREYLAWRAPRKVTEHPTRLDNSLWNWLIKTRHSAFSATQILDGPSPFDAGPSWCFNRFGRSKTALADSRVVYIGGEHEDHYDPDFFIYNDVVVLDPNGAISIYGYPKDKFAPTDFHSATLVDKRIVIIGGLGYPDARRAGSTPIYRLNLDRMRMEKLPSYGEAPGWIWGHQAVLAPDRRAILVRGGDVWTTNGETAKSQGVWKYEWSTGWWTRLPDLSLDAGAANQ